MTSITWASPRYVQELATILGPQNRTQGRCVAHYTFSHSHFYENRKYITNPIQQFWKLPKKTFKDPLLRGIFNY